MSRLNKSREEFDNLSLLGTKTFSKAYTRQLPIYTVHFGYIPRLFSHWELLATCIVISRCKILIFSHMTSHLFLLLVSLCMDMA